MAYCTVVYIQMNSMRIELLRLRNTGYIIIISQQGSLEIVILVLIFTFLKRTGRKLLFIRKFLILNFNEDFR